MAWPLPGLEKSKSVMIQGCPSNMILRPFFRSEAVYIAGCLSLFGTKKPCKYSALRPFPSNTGHGRTQTGKAAESPSQAVVMVATPGRWAVTTPVAESTEATAGSEEA